MPATRFSSHINSLTHGTVFGWDIDWGCGNRITQITDLNTASASHAYGHDWLDR